GTREVAATYVRLEEVGQGDLIEIVSAPGDIVAKTKVSISAKTSSQIIELPVEEGDLVKAGDVLVRLDDSDLSARLRAAEARQAGQRANLAVAEANLKAAE